MRTKQIDHIIVAFDKLAATFPDWRLIIVGDGEKARSLETLIGGLPCMGA